VGDLPWSKDERAWTCRDSALLFADDEQDFTLDHVEGLILVVMEMPGAAGSRGRDVLDQAESTAGLLTGGLDPHEAAKERERLRLVVRG
jgi:hypothetical protein